MGVEIHLSDTGKRFIKEWIFRNVSLSIASGEHVALVGPNGSGKSTFLQLLSGYSIPSNGKISWSLAGQSVTSEDIYLHQVMAAPYLEVPEELTWSELIRFHFSFKPMFSGLTEQEVLRYSGLQHAADRIIRQFSSGMKQRVRLTLACLSDTPLLLLDEPCSNLDRSAVEWYRALISQWGKGRTIVVCSNHQSEEYDFCSRVVDITPWKT